MLGIYIVYKDDSKVDVEDEGAKNRPWWATQFLPGHVATRVVLRDSWASHVEPVHRLVGNIRCFNSFQMKTFQFQFYNKNYFFNYFQYCNCMFQILFYFLLFK